MKYRRKARAVSKPETPPAFGKAWQIISSNYKAIADRDGAIACPGTESKRDSQTLHAISQTARPRGRNQNEILRVLRASKASTQRARRISVNSVSSFHLATENTEALLAREEIFARQQEVSN